MEELICVYRTHEYELKNKKFDNYAHFGKWVADNASDIILVDVIQYGEGI